MCLVSHFKWVDCLITGVWKHCLFRACLVWTSYCNMYVLLTYTRSYRALLALPWLKFHKGCYWQEPLWDDTKLFAVINTWQWKRTLIFDTFIEEFTHLAIFLPVAFSSSMRLASFRFELLVTVLLISPRKHNERISFGCESPSGLFYFLNDVQMK